ncbi:MAG: lamin tail domain-containing protein [Chitinispirillaceae bacterium]|nr:lamin tail domain-containing protein [Chitinispirillaceae bacterium]
MNHNLRRSAVVAIGVLAAGCALIDPPENIEVREYLYSIHCTEINYHPLGLDSTDADEYEFIELKNTADSSVSLADVGFTNGIDYTFPDDTRMEPGAFIVLASDSAGFIRRYGFAPFGVYAGKLSNGGEKVTLKDLTADKSFLSIEYDDNAPWPEAADGNGWTLVPVSADASGSDPDDPSSWRASFCRNGSPGADDPNIVLVNEVLTHTDPPLTDAVELYNPNGVDVDIGNWYLTDRRVDPMKFCIPAGTVVPANGYIVFDEEDFNADPSSPASFAFSEHGEEVYLFYDSTGMRSGSYYHGFSFGEMENGVSFGRHVTSSGGTDFVAQKSVTLGQANSGPLVGPVVITEIMYRPPDEISEFIELKNISGQSVQLFDPDTPSVTWKIDGVDFAFPPNTSLAPGEIAVVASNAVTADAFRSAYNVPEGVQIFSMTEALSNSGDSLTLLKPEEAYIDSAQGMTRVTPYMVRECIVFGDSGDWPSSPDGSGNSLQRKEETSYANDPDNWKGDEPTAGR